MAGRIRQEFEALKAAPPGRRFESGYERTHVRNRVLRLALVVLGVVLMVAAAVTFFLPGPNFVLVFAGLALVGGQSRHVARAMDRGEVGWRRWHSTVWEPYQHKRALGATAVVVVAAAAVGLYWLAGEHGWLPAWLPPWLPLS